MGLLSRLEAPTGTKEWPFIPVGGSNRDKMPAQPFVPVGATNRDKRPSFCPGWCLQPGQMHVSLGDFEKLSFSLYPCVPVPYHFVLLELSLTSTPLTLIFSLRGVLDLALGPGRRKREEAGGRRRGRPPSTPALLGAGPDAPAAPGLLPLAPPRAER